MKIMRDPERRAVTGLSNRQCARLEKAGAFPRRFKINPQGHACGWDADEIEAWQKARLASRDVSK